MVKNLILKGKNMFFARQDSVLSAAFVIMSMVFASQILGFVSKRIMLEFFNPKEYAMFLAAFRLPDFLFEILALGIFSSAFIPIVSKSLKSDPAKAWRISSSVVNFGLLIFVPIAILFVFFSSDIYHVIAPGFTNDQTETIASVARLLFLAQGVFIISYVITGVLEASRMFLVAAVAPVFYNIGIIFGTLVFSNSLGIFGPTIGVLIGASLHLLVQYPFAHKLGFRFSRKVELTDEIKEVGKLAAPRVFELSCLQLLKTSELFFASLVSVSAYTYLSLASALAAFPVTLLGLSLAKAALPTLSREYDHPHEFNKTLMTTLNQMMFFVIPVSMVLIVLRVPLVRLLFGTDNYDWAATVQTGLVLSAFAVGIPAQAAISLLSRAFYARGDTKTPVAFAVSDVLATILLQAIFVFVFNFPVWSLAWASTASGMVQAAALYIVLTIKVHRFRLFSLASVGKSILASIVSGFVIYTLLKTFDRSVWLKQISFIPQIDILRNLNFETFVLDTRYTPQLIALTAISSLAGLFIYIVLLWAMRSQELSAIMRIIRKRAFGRFGIGTETVTNPTVTQ